MNNEQPLVNVLNNIGLPVQERLEALAAVVACGATTLYFATLAELLDNDAESMELRCSVAIALGQLASPEALALLAKQLKHEDAAWRCCIVQALGESGESGHRSEKQTLAAATLILEGLQDKDDHVFGSAAEALGRLGKVVLPLLCDLLQTGGNDVRCVAAWQLGELADPQAVDLLVDKTRNDTNPDVQALCLWALGEIGLHTPAVLEVILWAKTQANPEIRLRAETAIKKVVRHAN